MRNLVCLLLLFIGLGTLSAQNDPHYSMFMFNKLAINPAYAGSKDALTLTGHYRNQWQGIDGAPKTFTFSGHAPFFKKRVGAGMSIVSDKIGMVNTLYIDMSYAYRMQLTDDATLSIGLQGQIDYGRIDWTMVDPLDAGDGMLPLAPTTKLNPNFGLGAYYAHPSYYIGVSVPRVLKTSIYDDNPTELVSINTLRSYYFMGGFISRLSKNVKLQPGALITMNPNAPFEFDLNLSFVFMDALWVGGSYRLGDSFDLILQYQFSKQMKAAIAADLTLTELRSYSPGSFEIMLEYTFIYDGLRYNNIRYF
ncbi:MAG: type IX secretion system membrane protein PorP/SprF [Bacteroidota bacterium]